jgi:hypothetical protein
MYGKKAACGLVALLCFTSGAVCVAKPPDLPVEQGIACPEGVDGPAPGDLFGPQRRSAAPVPVDSDVTDRTDEARQVFQKGERWRSMGALVKARTCFEEAHLLSPTSRFGRRAMQRLIELEQLDEPGEEQEEPQPRRTPTTLEPPLLKLPARARPLGLVERSY